MGPVVVDVRAGARRRAGVLVAGVREIEQMLGEIVRLAASDLDRTIVVLGRDQGEAAAATEAIRYAGFVRVMPMTVVGEGRHAADRKTTFRSTGCFSPLRLVSTL